MFLDKINLINFRLHENTELKFSEKLNFIFGGNGQGKTSILEAIYYLCTTKNFNSGSDSEIVSFKKDFFEVYGNFKDISGNDAKVYFDLNTNKKNYILDGKPVYKYSDVIGKFPVVTLTQTDHAITQGSPAERRKFVDSVISQTSNTYLKILIEYNKVLRQRSTLLTLLRENKSQSNIEQLNAWTKLLIQHGSEIITHRKNFIDVFNKYTANAYKKVTDSKEIPKIIYRFLGGTGYTDVNSTFIKRAEQVREDEIRRAANLVGPHRDDLLFFVNDLELKKFGSQGQHKTFQIALRFGQFFYLKDLLNKKPVFLLDDVFGELDNFRAINTSEFLNSIGQAFVTITDFSRYENLKKTDDSLFLKVTNGNAKYAKGF